jgi:hypothetical protein
MWLSLIKGSAFWDLFFILKRLAFCCILLAFSNVKSLLIKRLRSQAIFRLIRCLQSLILKIRLINLIRLLLEEHVLWILRTKWRILVERNIILSNGPSWQAIWILIEGSCCLGQIVLETRRLLFVVKLDRKGYIALGLQKRAKSLLKSQLKLH